MTRPGPWVNIRRVFRQRSLRLLPPALLATFALLALRGAWLGDDAFITLRTVENLVQGRGATWNPGERVQAYTHPLWMLAQAAAFAATGELRLTVYGLQLALSLFAAAWLAFVVARTREAAVAGLVLLGLTRAFVDYSTSGLENPLSHALLALFLALALAEAALPRDLGRLWFLAALVMTTRLDLALIVLPVAASRSWPLDRRRLAAIGLGLTPLVVWHIFALAYYGFAAPNTAYAKLATGVPSGDLAAQGLLYCADLVRRSPLAAAAILAGASQALLADRRSERAVGLGIALYVGYLVRVGGDFMTGRLFTPPFFASVALLVRGPLAARPRLALVVAGVALAIGLSWPGSPVRYGPQDGTRGAADWGLWHGITDERAVYAPATGLWRGPWPGPLPDHEFTREGRRVREAGGRVVYQKGVGMFAMAAGPEVHVVDGHGLADPLLARLPIATGRWRIGHFVRAAPVGYLETLASGQNLIEDPDLARYYDRLRLVVSGPLGSSERWRALLELNLGRHDHLIRRWRERRNQSRRERLAIQGGEAPADQQKSTR